MLAEANIRRLWTHRHEGAYVRAVLRQSIRDAQAWKRMGTDKPSFRPFAQPDPVDTHAVRSHDVTELVDFAEQPDGSVTIEPKAQETLW